MAYELRPVVGSPKKGKTGYPTVDKDGNVTLPGETEAIPPEKWTRLEIKSDAEYRDTSGMGISSAGTSRPVGTAEPVNSARTPRWKR
jgi:hypothetical protein